MSKVLFGHHGLRGDLAINLPAIEYIAAKYGVMVDMPIHKKFADMAPLFLNHWAINSVFITDEYEKFPNAKDTELLKLRGYEQVGNPMQPHLDEWWNFRHQTASVLWDYAREILPLEQQQINLVKWFDIQPCNKLVTIAPFAGYESNPNNDKMLSVARAAEIVSFLRARGWSTLQLGGPNEPNIPFATSEPKLCLNYFESVKAMLGSRLLIHTDTGMGWIASGYKHPQLGLYGHRYYGKDKVKNIQPVNPNGVYLDAPTVNEIPLDDIYKAIDKILGPAP